MPLTIDSDDGRLEETLRAVMEDFRRLRINVSDLSFAKDATVTRGGCGDVMMGVWKQRAVGSPAKIVAVKKLRSGDSWGRLRVLAACLQEVKIASELHHENILPVLGFCVDPDFTSPWVLTSWQSKGNLSEYLTSTEPSLDKRLELLADTANALVYLHALRPPVCHGDVKTENYVVSERGGAMLTDFGHSQILDNIPYEPRIKGGAQGTRRYLSPEILETGVIIWSLPRDVWAWGCTCLVVITGLQPYHDQDSEPALRRAVLSRVLPARLQSPEIPGALKALLSKCWEWAPQDRPTMGYLAEAIRGYIETTLSMPSRSYNTSARRAEALSSQIDYEKLERSLMGTLPSLQHLYIDRPGVTIGSRKFSAGFADVYVGTVDAENASFQVAVKKLRPYGERDTCLRVAAALARELHAWTMVQPEHPNVLAIIGYHLDVITFKEAWIITPWQDNGNLEGYLKTTKPNEVRRLELASDTAAGLSYLHSLATPLCHGDIKPTNAVISGDGKVMLCDFGLSRLLASSNTGLTTEEFNCTLRYASPEAERDGSTSLASDVWAWGGLLLYVIADIHPYQSEKSDIELCKAMIAQHPPVDLTEIRAPLPLKTVMAQCWNIAPEGRPSMSWCLETVTTASLKYLSACFELIQRLWESAQKVHVHTARCQELARKAAEIVCILDNHAMNGDIPSPLESEIKMTHRMLNTIWEDLQAWAARGNLRSWLQRPEIARKITEHQDSVQECRIRVIVRVTKLAETTNAMAGSLDKKIDGTERILSTSTTGSQQYREAQEESLELRRGLIGPRALALPASLGRQCVRMGDRAVKSGSTFDVWRGTLLGSSDVAMKLLRNVRATSLDNTNRKACERFLCQIDIWRTLNNQHVLKVHGWCAIDDELYLVSPWMVNGDICSYLSVKKCTPDEYLELLKDILRGLKYLHSENILHGSLQPSNILIEAEGYAVLSDFALAKEFALAMNSGSHISPQALRYQAPEIDGVNTMSPASDVWSWSMTSVEIISGVRPFEGIRTLVALFKARMDPAKLPKPVDYQCRTFGTYPALWDILESCWVEPDGRPAVDELLEMLDKLRSSSNELGWA